MDVERFVSIEEATYQIGTIRAKKRDRLIEEENEKERQRRADLLRVVERNTRYISPLSVWLSSQFINCFIISRRRLSMFLSLIPEKRYRKPFTFRVKGETAAEKAIEFLFWKSIVNCPRRKL